MGADRTYRGMQKESDVADRKGRDLADFLVAQVALELEVHHFALIRRKFRDRFADPADGLLHVVTLVQVRRDGELVRVERCHANRLLSRVEREVPTHGEQPGREMAFDASPILPAQPQKRFLHHVPRGLDVAEQTRRVADQRPLVTLQRLDDPVGFRRPAHSVSMWITTLGPFY